VLSFLHETASSAIDRPGPFSPPVEFKIWPLRTPPVNLARYILGIPLVTLGAIILLLHLFLFIRGVLFQRQVPSALPVINCFILAIGFALLPISSGLMLGITLAAADLVLTTSVNAFRR
jgi:hypothetical protein